MHDVRDVLLRLMGYTPVVPVVSPTSPINIQKNIEGSASRNVQISYSAPNKPTEVEPLTPDQKNQSLSERKSAKIEEVGEESEEDQLTEATVVSPKFINIPVLNEEQKNIRANSTLSKDEERSLEIQIMRPNAVNDESEISSEEDRQADHLDQGHDQPENFSKANTGTEELFDFEESETPESQKDTSHESPNQKMLTAKKIQKEINFLLENGETLLTNAIKNEKPSLVKGIISNKADVALANSSEETPLEIAILYDNLDIVKQLLEAGAAIPRGKKFVQLIEHHPEIQNEIKDFLTPKKTKAQQQKSI